jgi:biopolymer transport protein ExbD
VSNPFVRHEEANPISDVNVVPLADVSLVLLIILLVLSPMAAQSMLKVQTAAAKAAADSQSPPPPEEATPLKPPEPVLAIGLLEYGWVIDGRFVPGDDELKARLAPVLGKREDKKIFLSPELEVPNGRVVSAIETLQACGASAVALVQVVDPDAASQAVR